MDTLGKGIVAGFIATLALSLLLDPIAMLIDMVGVSSSSHGLMLHFFVGTLVWGAIFAFLHDHLPGASWLRGVIFGVSAWLVVMVAAMPLAGAGLFAMKFGLAAPLATLIIHAIYGAVLGAVYGALLNHGDSPSSFDRPHRDEHFRPFPR